MKYNCSAQQESCACANQNIELVILMSMGSFFINVFCVSFLFCDNVLTVELSIYIMYYISFLIFENVLQVKISIYIMKWMTNIILRTI